MIKELSGLSGSDLYPFHMPGHKRQRTGVWLDEAYAHDITEIDGFDDLQDPKGIIADIESRIRKLYGADRAFLSVNGSTCGNLSAVSSLTPFGGCLMMDRGCHRSIYNVAYIRQLKIMHLERETIPETGLTACISFEEAERRISDAVKTGQKPDVMVITSPTYEGFIADVDGIAELAHGYGIPLIADSAHGAHLPISKRADVTVVSLHKTLPAMTQVSAVLLNGDLVDPEDIKRYINIYQTTSPSYVLMASAENCLDIMENEGEKRKADLKERINRLYVLNRRLRRLWLTGPEFKGKYGINDFDMSRINLFDRTGRTDGKGLYDILRKEYRLQPEKHTGNTCLLISGIMDTEEGFRRLEDAILSIDRK